MMARELLGTCVPVSFPPDDVIKKGMTRRVESDERVRVLAMLKYTNRIHSIVASSPPCDDMAVRTGTTWCRDCR